MLREKIQAGWSSKPATQDQRYLHTLCGGVPGLNALLLNAIFPFFSEDLRI